MESGVRKTARGIEYCALLKKEKWFIMKFQIPAQTAEDAFILFKEKLREADVDNCELAVGNGIFTVSISYWGTSTLTFSVKELGKWVEFTLVKEDIAWTHRGKRKLMYATVETLIVKAGGRMLV